MKIWKAHYKDEHHDLDIDIINTEEEYGTNPLSFQIGDYRFVGTSIGDFELENPQLYGQAKKQFHIIKCGPYSNEYYYKLQRYYMEVYLPIPVLKKIDYSLVTGILHIIFEYKEHNIEKNKQL